MELEYLPVDVFGLPDFARTLLARRPSPPELPGLTSPARLEELPAPPQGSDARERSFLSRRLEQAAAAREPHVAVLDAARALADTSASVVLAYARPGFLGGALENLYAGLHAIVLAERLALLWETPVVPLLWNAGPEPEDERGGAEVLINEHLLLRSLRPPKHYRPDGARGEEYDLSAIEEVLRKELYDSAARDQALHLFLPHDGETTSEAFTRALSHLLGPYGLLVVESAWLREELAHATADLVGCNLSANLDTAIGGWGEFRNEAAQAWEAKTIVQHRVRGAIRFRAGEGGRLSFDEEPGDRTHAELAAELLQESKDWVPGPRLLPTVLEHILPVAAHIGDWNRMAAAAQMRIVRSKLGISAAPWVPQVACTLVDAGCARALQRLDIRLVDVLRRRGDLTGKVPDPAPVLADLRGVAESTAGSLRALRAELAGLDRGLAVQLRRTADLVAQQIEDLCRRAERVDSNRSGKLQRHARRLSATLCPLGEPQQRTLMCLQAASQHGTAWIHELASAIDPLPVEHLAAFLPPAAGEETEAD